MLDQVEFLMKLGFEFLNVSVCYGYDIPQCLTTFVPLKDYVVNFGKLY